MSAAPPDVTVVITTFDVRELLARCLDRLDAAAGGLTLEVVVVDNGYGDGTWQMLLERRGVRAIRGSPDIGYGAANNIGAAAGAAPLILFLNPDTEPDPASIAVLADHLRTRQDAAAAGPRLTLTDGRPDLAGLRSFPRPASALYHFLGSPRLPGVDVARPYHPDDLTSVGEVDAVCGACLMVRRDAFQAVGGFDPGFFMYGDELDLHRRLADAGWRTLYVPEALVWHHKRQSSRQRRVRTRVEFYRSMRRYYRKHHARDPWAVRALVVSGILALGAGGVLRALAAWRPSRRRAA